MLLPRLSLCAIIVESQSDRAINERVGRVAGGDVDGL